MIPSILSIKKNTLLVFRSKSNLGTKKIRIGGLKLSKRMRTLSVINVIPHEEYDARTMENDIALIKIHPPISFTPEVLPICLPASKKKNLYDGKICKSIGWGAMYGKAI